MIRTIGSRLGELDWSSVVPGDVVQVPYRPDPYREKILLFGNGYTLKGLPGPNGELPIIDGTNATTDPQFTVSSYRLTEDAGVVAIYTRPGQTSRPGQITIDGFEIRGGSLDNPDPTYTAFDGTKRTYDISASGIYCVTGDDITVKNCVLHGNGNGVLVIGSHNCQRWRLQDCNVYGNGKVGSDHQHGTYCEVLGGITYIRMTYGDNRPGSAGGQLKDRSCGPVVKDCVFSGGGQRIIDFSQPQDTIAAAESDPLYLQATVQNCWLKNTTGSAVAFIYAEPRPGHLIEIGQVTFDVKRDQADTWRLILAKIETDGPTNFTFDKCLISVRPLTTGSSPPELSASNGFGHCAFSPNRTDGVTLMKCRTGVIDNGTYVGWENVGPGDNTGFGYSAPVIAPPIPPPANWTEVNRQRLEDNDMAVETILYRKS